MKLKFRNLEYAYNNLLKIRKYADSFEIGKHIGYLEACLLNFGVLEIEKVGNDNLIKREIIKSSKWWKKDRLETYEEAIVRMAKKYLNGKNIQNSKN